jgi:hypothetical protein
VRADIVSTGRRYCVRSVIGLARLLREEQVLQVDHAQHVFAIGIEIGIAAEAVAHHRLQVVFQRLAGVERDHFADRAHQVGHRQLGEIERLGQDVALVAGEFFARLAGAQDQLELLVRVVGVVAALAIQAGQPQHHVGAAVEHPDRRVHRPVEAVQRQRAPQADDFRIADRQRLRRQFADHDVQEGDHAEGEHEGHAVHHFGRGDADQGEQRLEQAANAGSPTQPRPSEASVMPSWQADR